MTFTDKDSAAEIKLTAPGRVRTRFPRNAADAAKISVQAARKGRASAKSRRKNAPRAAPHKAAKA